MYIGKQQILNEQVDGNYVKVTLKTLEVDELDNETEDVLFNQRTLDTVKSEGPNHDDTDIRSKRCADVIDEVVMVLMKYNVQLNDADHIFTYVMETIRQAKLRKERKVYGNNEFKRTAMQFADEIFKK